MKKALSLILAFVLCLSLCACGSEENATSKKEDNTAPVYAIGDTVSTDILKFTLDEATLAIALSNVIDNTYCAPKEFDAQTDGNNPLVCGKGHTFAAFTYTIENLDRTNYNGTLPMVSAKYQDKISDKQVDGAEYHKESDTWKRTGNNLTSPVYSWHFVLETGTARTYRSFIDIPVEATDLKDNYELIVKLPASDGSTTSFVFLVEQN